MPAKAGRHAEKVRQQNPLALRRIAETQEEVVSRIQLAAAGYDSDAARRRVAAGLWQRVGHAFVLENGRVSCAQRQWAAVLSAPGLVAVTARTAAERYGLRGFPSDTIDVLVPRGANHPVPIDGVRWRESRCFGAADIARAFGIPTVSRGRAIIDAAAWTPKPRVACALLAAAVQQRVVPAAALRRELSVPRGLRHIRLFRSILADIEGGADSLAEIDFVVLARKAGLPPPIRQSFRVDAAGRRRYLDVDFGTFCVEVDGGVHLRPMNYWDDARRQNDLVLGGDRILRFPSIAIRLDEEVVLAQLRKAHLIFG